VVYDFVVGDGLPALPTEANGWKYAPGATLDRTLVSQIAAALGLSGEPAARPAEQGGGWLIGPEDGSAPALWITADAQLSWWYNGAAAVVTDAVGGCARPVELVPPDEAGTADTSDGNATSGGSGDDEAPPPPDECVFEEPEPPTGILTANQARSRAIELLEQMGADPEGFAIEVYSDDWYASVSALEKFGATTSPVGWYFGFGAEGRLDYASGVLARPQEVGPYALVDLETALARLQDGYLGGVRTLAADAAVSLDAPQVSCVEGTDCAFPTEPERVTVTVTDVRQDLWWVWDVDGTVWLLPAFRFIGSDGGEFTVPAVSDEYLIVEDYVGDPAVDEPAPPTDVDGSVVVSEEDAAALIGLSEAEAVDTAMAAGWTVRIVARDGEQFAVTDDYLTARVNLTIEGDTVTAVTVG
jgi:hypothetical protein